MTAITTYTSYDEVRATLGVSATELADSILSQEQWATLLSFDFDDINSGVASQYTTVSAIAEVSRTAEQQKFYMLVRVFAAYSLSRNLLTSLPLFSAERLTDGRAEFQRQSDTLADVRIAVEGMFNTLRKRLSAYYLLLVPSASGYTPTTFSFTVSIGLAVDPVTNA